jgi:hypothetical protein
MDYCLAYSTDDALLFGFLVTINNPDPPSPLKKGEPELNSKSPFLRGI